MLLKSGRPMIGRSRLDGSSFRASWRGLPCESFGALSQTIVLQIPRPHFLISTFAEPSSLAQMPEGSAAEASDGLPVTNRTVAMRLSAGPNALCFIEHLSCRVCAELTYAPKPV